MPSGFQAFGSAEGYVGSAPATPLNDALYQFGNLVGRWRADMLVTGTSTVTAWGDLSGTGDTNRNASAAGSDRPALVASDAGMNGLPVISFSSTQAMKTGTWLIAQVQPLTVALFGYNPTTTGNNVAYDGLANLSFTLVIDAALGAYIAAPTRLGSGSYHTTKAMLLGEFNGGSSKVFESSATPLATGNAGTNGFTGMTLGNRFSNILSNNWQIAEIAVWSKVLSAQNKLDLAAYATSRYGITIS